MSELWATAREAVRALAASDPRLRRFGAAHHRYELAPAVSAEVLAGAEARLGRALPDELAGFARELAAGGAGPGYGIVPVDRTERTEHPAREERAERTELADRAEHADRAGHADRPDQADRAQAPPGAPWNAGLPLAHLGCGYLAVMPLDGDARGEVWIDARSVGVVRPIAPGFVAFYLDWIDRLAHGRWPDSPVPPGACALAAALSGYLARCEAEHGVAPGALTGAALRQALSRLGTGAIAITADAGVWFDDGDRVDPCITCARLIESLGAEGLRADVVAPGLPPRPVR